VLKNVLDWLSRPPAPPFDGKPVAIMGASPGPVGTARVQYHLRQVLVFMNTFTVNKPEVFINHCAGKFNEKGELTDEASAKFIGELLVSLQNLKARVG
jgi:chromate reductase